MKDECVSLPKWQSQLAQLHDDDEDVFATSLIDRYASHFLFLIYTKGSMAGQVLLCDQVSDFKS